MSKRCIGWWLLIVLSSSFAAGQKYERNTYLRGGLSLFISGAKNEDPFFLGGATVTPGLRIFQGKDMSLVWTAPISVGASFRDLEDSYFGFDAVSMLEMHFGAATANSSKNRKGFMLGAGAGYILTAHEEYWSGDTRRIDYWGMRFHTGIILGSEDDGSHGMILLGYGRGFTSRPKHTITLGFAFVMGNVTKRP